MKVFEFTNSFVVLKDIRTVIIKSQKIDHGVVIEDDEDSKDKWYLKIIYNNDSSFKTYYASRGEARADYFKLLSVMKGSYSEENSKVTTSGIPMGIF